MACYYALSQNSGRAVWYRQSQLGRLSLGENLQLTLKPALVYKIEEVL